MCRMVATLMVSILFVSIPGFSQTSSNAQLSGVVTDQSGALIPGVTITATRALTGVVNTTVTNEAGVYNFQALQPGSGYSVSASLPGFQTLTYTNLELSAAAVSRQNFRLQVAGAATTVEVSIEAGLQALTETSSVGDVLPEQRIRNLPLVGNNVLEILDIMPGIRMNGTGIWMGDYANTVAGQGLDSLNVTLDGLPMRDERFSAQAGFQQGITLGGELSGGTAYTGGNMMLSTTVLNPDLVGEIRLILAPVDAELGRGNSQIQVTTRSGTNKFSGSAAWNIQNTSLNPNTWNRNNNYGNATTGCRIKGETPPCWNPTEPEWRNQNEYTVSFGGPIIRNKTFFFVLWNQQITRTRSVYTPEVLTDTARNGIYRYWEGWVPGDADEPTTAVTSTDLNPITPSIDFFGNPLLPARWPNGNAYTGRLVCFSVFGTLKADGSPFGAADCPSGTDFNGRSYTGLAVTSPGGLWDTKRPGPAAAALGYFNKILAKMPRSNEWAEGNYTGIGDGLNVGYYRWLVTRRGGSGDFGELQGNAQALNTVVGSSPYQNRKQINIKIDQNFGSHRLYGNWTHQYDDSDNPIALWPNGMSGSSRRRPHTFGVNLTSTLGSSLVNEGRFGLNLNEAENINPWNSSDSTIRDRALSLMLQGGSSLSGNGNIYPVLVRPGQGFGALNFDNGLMDTGATEVSYSNPLYNFADTLSWARGKHAFKFGGDFRFPRSEGYTLQPLPVAGFGNIGGVNTESPFANVGNTPSLGTTGTPNAANTSNLFTQNARNTARNLAYLLTNSLGPISTPYWAENFAQVSAGKAGWQDVTTQQNRIREMVYNDFSIFAKDDYKLTPTLTLNLGVRYEYYAPPFITSGLTSTAVGQGYGLFGAGRGAGGALFDNWLSPGNLYLTGYGTNGTGPFTNGLGSADVSLTCSSTPVGTLASRLPAPNCDPSLMSNIEFIGPNSPNPDKTIIPRDRNNFGPAVGFAWQVPWFGQGKTTLRGGYQVTFQRVTIGENTLAAALGGFLDQGANDNDPAIEAIAGAAGLNRAVLLSDLPALVPVPPSRAPGRNVSVYGRSESFTAYDPNYATPYTQNLTLSVTRSLSRQLTLDVRYIGSLGRKLPGSLNLNESTVFRNQELFDAFLAARRGENPTLLDQMLAGLDLAPRTGNTDWSLGGATGSYPTDRLYGPIGTCMTLVDIAGFDTPPLPADPRCPAGQVFNSGAEHLRRAAGSGTYNTASRLADGEFGLLANILAGNTAPTGGLQPLTVPVGGVTPSQRVLRNGCDRIANGLYNVSTPTVYPTVDPRASTFGVVRTGNIPTRCFPENYLIANPQLNNATYNANLGRNNYHSLQVQFNVRNLHGFSAQTSYTWAKSMVLPSRGYNDPLNREFDRQLGNERKHDFRMNGTVELPLGPNKLLLRSTSGWVARVFEGWQLGYIFSMSSGTPATVSGVAQTRYAVNQDRPIPASLASPRFNPTEHWKIPKGKVLFGGAGLDLVLPYGYQSGELGYFFGVDVPGNVGSFTDVLDPACFDPSQVAQTDSRGYQFALSSGGCSMRALAQRVPAGTPGSFFLDKVNQTDPAVYVLLQPKPGEVGRLAPKHLTLFGTWNLDANIQKSFAISESKQLTIRIDATNVLNHPQPFIPAFSTRDNYTQFGIIQCGCGDSKSGIRNFQGQVRLTF